ncbi:TPA: hypothetical protein PI122_001150 [Staphylococcus aureus]|nr:hypothetical protein [Staphylococcus aureus]HCX9223827.1 hypothetical protein [Staphylococcus aureus]HDH4504460.1 hypothetical protein [Staphylococcus aureus]HDI5070842.1 hypothetical protein [Staphylococcus aureus]
MFVKYRWFRRDSTLAHWALHHFQDTEMSLLQTSEYSPLTSLRKTKEAKQ